VTSHSEFYQKLKDFYSKTQKFSQKLKQFSQKLNVSENLFSCDPRKSAKRQACFILLLPEGEAMHQHEANFNYRYSLFFAKKKASNLSIHSGNMSLLFTT